MVHHWSTSHATGSTALSIASVIRAVGREWIGVGRVVGVS